MQHDNSPAAVRGRAEKVFFCLSPGRGNAVKGEDVRRLTGLPDRAMRKALESLRRGGVVICADDSGYFLPETEGELRAYIGQEQHRLDAVALNLEAARALLEGGAMNEL